MLKSPLVMASTILVLLLAACGTREANTSSASTRGSDVGEAYVEGGPPVDPGIWKNPLGDDGVQVSSVSEANLVYSPAVPDELDDARSIVATKASEAEPAFRKIAWVFDDAKYGPFFVQEEIAEAVAAQSELEAMGTATPGCTPITPEDPEGDATSGTRCISEGFSLVEIRDGISALLVQGPEVTSVTWVEPVSSSDQDALDSFRNPGLLIAVVGPSSTFSGEFAVEVASKT